MKQSDEKEQLIGEIDRMINDRLGGSKKRGIFSLKKSTVEEIKTELPKEEVGKNAISFDEEISLSAPSIESQSFYDDEESLVAKTDATSEQDFDLEFGLSDQPVPAAPKLNNQSTAQGPALVAPIQDQSKRRLGIVKPIQYIFVSLVIIGLLISFMYQLWHMPSKQLRNNVGLQTFLNSSLTPLIETANGFGFSLAKPNSLTGITLLSAQAEPHPNRPTTTLLKVSFVNKSSTQQELPWLELSLTDSDGKVVARRALEPKDYIYNNVTDVQIGAHELKKVTIELLSFPKRATGYELKMLQSQNG